MWILNTNNNTILLICIMSVFAIQDIIKQKISLKYSIIVMVSSILLTIAQVVSCNKNIVCLMTGIIPSVMIWAMVYLTNEKIGKGDAVAIFITGVLTNIWFVMSAILVSLWICSLFAIVELAINKKMKDETLPYIPFLLMGVIISYVN